MSELIGLHPCNMCGIATEHDSTRIYRKDNIDFEIPSSFKAASSICCRGCKTASIFEIISDSKGIILNYYPPRLWKSLPDWVAKLEEIDDKLYGLLNEVYSAANETQFRLLAMGVRSALDHTMINILGHDIGTFEDKLKEMVKQDHISKNQKEMILTTIDAGSAATHRGFKPPRDLLEQMLSVMEIIIQTHYITGPMMQTMKTIIPPRPPFKKKE